MFTRSPDRLGSLGSEVVITRLHSVGERMVIPGQAVIGPSLVEPGTGRLVGVQAARAGICGLSLCETVGGCESGASLGSSGVLLPRARR